MNKAIESKMNINSKSFRHFGVDGNNAFSPVSDSKMKILSPQIVSNYKDSSEIGTKRIKLIEKFGNSINSINQTDIKSENPYQNPSKMNPVEYKPTASSSTMIQKYTKPISLSSTRKTKKPSLVIKNGKLLIGSKIK